MKSLLTKALVGAAIAVGSLTAISAPANAGTCWFRAGGSSLVPSYCWTNQRVNGNGHNVMDVRDFKGTEFTLVFWDNGEAEIIYTSGYRRGEVITVDWYWDAQGDRRLDDQQGWEMGISPINPN